MTLFHDNRRKDFIEQVVHHIATVSLLGMIHFIPRMKVGGHKSEWTAIENDGLFSYFRIVYFLSLFALRPTIHSNSRLLWVTKAHFDAKDRPLWISSFIWSLKIFLALSYASNFTRVGALVMWCHDISDIFLEFAKLCKYSKYEKTADVAFAIFMIVFFVR